MQCEFNDTLTFIAKDGYTLGVTLTSGRPDMVRVFDELGESPFETLEFDYLLEKYRSGDGLRLSYALTPARDIQDARKLAHSATEIVETINSEQIPAYVTPLLITLLLTLTSVAVLERWLTHHSPTRY